MGARDDLGRFVWHDLMTTDLAAAVAFYTGLFPEWTLPERGLPNGASFRMVEVGGRAGGCLIPFDAAHGVPSHWVGYVAVEDCDATVARMEALSGKTCYPGFTIPGVGRFAMMSDPQGALIKPFQSERPSPGSDRMAVGAVCWNELMTTGFDAARGFYADVFGWESVSNDMGGGMTYTVFRKGGVDVGGGMERPAGNTAPPHWVYYFAADDVDSRTRTATGLGAKLYMGPADIPGIGRFSVLADPTGAEFALFQGPRG